MESNHKENDEFESNAQIINQTKDRIKKSRKDLNQLRSKIYRSVKRCGDKTKKRCLHPLCTSDTIIKAHSIQRGTVLDLISGGRELMTFNRRPTSFYFNIFTFFREHSSIRQAFSIFLNIMNIPPPLPGAQDAAFIKTFITFISNLDPEKIGKKSASTFKGFCKKHDRAVFLPIENVSTPYEKTLSQNFLYAYRSLAYEYMVDLETLCTTSVVMKEMPRTLKALFPEDASNETKNYVTTNGVSLFRQHSTLRSNDIENHLSRFSKELQKDETLCDYRIIKSKIFEFSFISLFAVNAAFYIVYDLKGRILNDVSSSDEKLVLHPVFCNIFPDENTNKTYAIFSYFKSSSSVYDDFFDQISLNHNEDRIQEIISNIVISYAGNFYLSQSHYENLSSHKKKKIKDLFYSTVFQGISKRQLKKKPPINLFQKFREVDRPNAKGDKRHKRNQRKFRKKRKKGSNILHKSRL